MIRSFFHSQRLLVFFFLQLVPKKFHFFLKYKNIKIVVHSTLIYNIAKKVTLSGKRTFFRKKSPPRLKHSTNKRTNIHFFGQKSPTIATISLNFLFNYLQNFQTHSIHTFMHKNFFLFLHRQIRRLNTFGGGSRDFFLFGTWGGD